MGICCCSVCEQTQWMDSPNPGFFWMQIIGVLLQYLMAVLIKSHEISKLWDSCSKWWLNRPEIWRWAQLPNHRSNFNATMRFNPISRLGNFVKLTRCYNFIGYLNWSSILDSGKFTAYETERCSCKWIDQADRPTNRSTVEPERMLRRHGYTDDLIVTTFKTSGDCKALIVTAFRFGESIVIVKVVAIKAKRSI